MALTDQELDAILDIAANLQDGSPRTIMRALEDASRLPPLSRAQVVLVLLDLAKSTAVGPVSHPNPYGAPLEGKESIAAHAIMALEGMLDHIPHDELATLLLSWQTFDVPDAAFDQGVYIGD